MYVEHQLIRRESVEHRDYQASVARAALAKSSLVVIPTGLGKTVVALHVIAETLLRKKGKVLFLAPTKPLVLQHAQFLERTLEGVEIAYFTGEVRPSTRKELWDSAQVVVSTPQVIQNDLISGIIEAKGVSLIVFDEVHRAVGEYAYVYIGQMFRQPGVRTLGMTASPGFSVEHIREVCRNVNIENVEIKTEWDPDVAPYIQTVGIEWLAIEPPGRAKEITKLLRNSYDRCVRSLRETGAFAGKAKVSVGDLLALRSELQTRLKSGQKDGAIYQALSLQAQAMKLNHAVQLAETQTAEALALYLGKLIDEGRGTGGSRASRQIAEDPDVKGALYLVMELEQQHPKVGFICDLVRAETGRDPKSRVIVFTNFRDTAEVVRGALSQIPGIRVSRFVGQASRNGDTGMSQREQGDVLQAFKDGEFNVLVATSVGEEGIDIPATDLVIFHEPIPSEIRTIQRRGRTGRLHAGRVVVLMYKGTRDVAYHYSARKKEKQMRDELYRIKKALAAEMSVDASKTLDQILGGDAEKESQLRLDQSPPRADDEKAGSRPIPDAEGRSEESADEKNHPVKSGESAGEEVHPENSDDGEEAVGALPESIDLTLEPASGGKFDIDMLEKGTIDPDMLDERLRDRLKSLDDGAKSQPRSAGEEIFDELARRRREAGGGEPETAANGKPSAIGKESPETAVTRAPAPAAKRSAKSPAPKSGLQRSLADFSGSDGSPPDGEGKLTIVVDNREFNSPVARHLSREGIIVVPRTMPAGDYAISQRLIVERKETSDFVASVKDGRLFPQLKSLCEASPKRVMIVEGDDLLTCSGMSQGSIRGVLASISVDFDVTILTTKDALETAQMLASFARHEAKEGAGPPDIRGDKRGMNARDAMRFLVEGLPGVRGTLATRLLEHFGSVERIFTATEGELMEVKGVGRQTARQIREALTGKWE